MDVYGISWYIFSYYEVKLIKCRLCPTSEIDTEIACVSGLEPYHPSMNGIVQEGRTRLVRCGNPHGFPENDRATYFWWIKPT